MPANQLITALRSHAVDAILVTEPQIYQAESQIGARTVLDACSGETVNLPLDGYFAPASYAKQHQDALAAFHAALMRAQASANQPAPLNSALTHYAGMSRETASLITVGAVPHLAEGDQPAAGRGPDVLLRLALATARRSKDGLPVAPAVSQAGPGRPGSSTMTRAPASLLIWHNDSRRPPWLLVASVIPRPARSGG